MDFKRDKAGKETIVFEDAHGKPVTESQVIKRSKLVLGSTDVKPVSKMITDPMAQEPTITVEMTISGKKKLADFTRRNEGEILAIIVNGKIISAPTVEEPIKNGSVVIRGLFSKQEAQRIADAINAGASSNK